VLDQAPAGDFADLIYDVVADDADVDFELQQTQLQHQLLLLQLCVYRRLALAVCS